MCIAEWTGLPTGHEESKPLASGRTRPRSSLPSPPITARGTGVSGPQAPRRRVWEDPHPRACTLCTFGRPHLGKACAGASPARTLLLFAPTPCDLGGRVCHEAQPLLVDTGLGSAGVEASRSPQNPGALGLLSGLVSQAPARKGCEKWPRSRIKGTGLPSLFLSAQKRVVAKTK